MSAPKRRRSALESFDGCPFRYNALYNQGQEDRGDESHRGIAFHEMAFRYVEMLADAKVPADADLASRAFKQGVAVTQVAFHLLDELKKIWGRFTEWFQLDLDAYLEAEQRQETDRFTWIPDLVYVRPQGIEIWDWKTYYKGLTETQARREFQLKFYLLQALEIWPNFPSYTFVFVFVRIGYSVRVTMTPDQIEGFRDEVEAILLALQAAEVSQQYPAIPGSHCTLCRLACPIVDNPKRLPIRLTTRADADATAGEILVLEQRLKVLRKSLAGWCNQEGPLVVKGEEFAHRSAISRRYPADIVMELLAGAYDKPAAPLVSTSAIKAVDPLKALLSNTTVAEDLDAAAVSTTRWAFRHKKAGELDVADDDEDD